MATVLGLVGSATLTSIERASAQSEVISVYSLLKKSSVQSFTTGGPVTLVFEGPSVNIMIGLNRHSQTSFEHLIFNEQRLKFNRNGLPNKLIITLLVRGVERELDLHSVFSNLTSFGSDRGQGFEG
jgi:hypothetical protein